MKNILKRGTSLLLVVAMLLSFAVVVGAEDTTSTSPMTLRVGDVPLEAGKEALVPVYATIAAGVQITYLDLAVSCDTGVTIKGMEDRIATGGYDASGRPAYNDGELKYLGGNIENHFLEDGKLYKIGWIAQSGAWLTTTNSPLFWIRVEATTDTPVGGYEIKLGANPSAAEVGKVFGVNDENSEDGVHHYGESDTKVEDGAAIVYNDLPMVALTKTTFDVPTMAEQIAPGYKKGDYELNQYLKIVYQDGAGNVQMDDVSSATMAKKSEAPWTSSKVTFSTVNNKLSINPAAANQSQGTLTVTEATAKTSNVTYQVNSDVTFKVSKKASELTSLAFTNNRIEDNANISAPAQNTQNYVDLGLGLQGEDQYGVDMALTSSNVTVEFYSDSACTNKIGTTPTGITLESNKIHIVCTLENDVWCKLTATGVAGEKSLTKTVTFKIESTKPHATRAEIVLKDARGQEITPDSSGKSDTWYVPTNDTPLTIYISANIKDQKGNPMSGESYGIHAKNGTSEELGAGIKVEPVTNEADQDKGAYKLVVTKDALARTDFPITITLNATKADNGNVDLEDSRTITLQREPSKAATLATDNSGALEYGKLVPNAASATAPGIGETKQLITEIPYPNVLDQYGNKMMDGNTEIKVSSSGFKLYRAVESNAEGAITYGGKQYAKDGAAIGSELVEFADNSVSGTVVLKARNTKINGDLALDEGHYIVEATYPNPSNAEQPLVARCVIKLTKSDSVPTTARVTASTETIYVPYASEYGTLGEGKSSEVTLRATVKDQYGDPITEGVTLAKVGNDIDLYDSNDNHVIKLDNNSTAAYVSEQNGTVRISVSEDLAGYMKRNGTVVTNGELRLPVKVTVGEGEHALTFNTTAKVNVSREASALKKATVTIKDATTGATVKTVTLTAANETINMITPKTETSYTIEFSGKDQYGDTLTDEFVSGATAEPSGKFSWWRPNQESSYRMTVDATTKGLYQFTTRNFKYKVNVKFAPMQFVKGETGSEQITAKDMLNDSNIPRTYNGLTWKTILDDVKKNQDVYIMSQTEGVNNTEVEAGSISYKVVSVDADGHETEIPDTAKANAGSYKIKVIYTKDGQTYDVCETETFTISPKELELVAKTGTKISKVYDGTDAYPTAELSKLKISDYFEIQSGAISGDNVALNDVAPTQVKFLKTDATSASDAEKDLVAVVYMPENALTDPNYKLKPATGSTVAFNAAGEITAKSITVEITIADKYWDGTKNGTVSAAITDGVLPADAEKVTVNAATPTTEIFANSDAGSGLIANLDPLTRFGLSLSGDKAKNYNIFTIETPNDVKIKQATFTIRLSENDTEITYGNDATVQNITKNNLYRGTTPIESGLTFTENELTLGVKNVDGTAASRNGNGHYNVITNKSNNYYLLTAPQSENPTNYKFELAENYTLKILPLMFKIKLAPGSEQKLTKIYDGTTDLKGVTDADFVLTPDLPEGVTAILNETYTLVASTLTYADKNVGTNKTINGGALKVNGELVSESTKTKGTNYRFSPTAGLKGEITGKDINGEDIEVVLQDLYYTGEYVDLCDAVVKLRDKTLGVDLVKGVDWDFAGACGTTNAGESQTVSIYGKGNYGIPNNYRAFTVTLQKAGAALDDTQLKGKQATRNKTNVIELSPKYKLAENPTIEVVDSSEWLDNSSVSAKYEDGKIKITLNVKDGPVTETSKVKLKLTIAGTSNYEVTVKEFDVKIIEKLVQNFKIDQGESGTYSYSQGGVQLTTSGNEGDVTWSSSNPDAATVDGNGKVTFVKPGNVTITATANETDDYAATSDTYTLTITKGQVTITASSATMTANDPLPGFSATASGLNPNDSVSEVFQTLTATVSTDGKTAGTYRVTPNAVLKAGWDAYYDLSFVQGTLTVNPAASVIDTILPTIIAGNGCANGYANCACESFYDLDASRWYHEAIDWAYNLGLMNGTTKSTFGPNAAATRAQTWTMLARIAGQDTRRSSTWYEVGQKWAMNLGITDGTNPMGSLTREQLAAMLYRYVGSPAVNGTLTFTDSANVSAWARNAMIWAVQNGILDGVGGNRLNPKGTTTRAQAAAIFMRFSKLINK